MASLNFYLRDSKAQGQTSIIAFFRYDSKTAKIYTGESIEPENWSNKKKSFNPSYPHKVDRERTLNYIKLTIETCYNHFKVKNESEPTPTEIKDLSLSVIKYIKNNDLSFDKDDIRLILERNLYEERNGEQIPSSFFDYYNYFLEQKKRFSKSSIERLRAYTIALKFLKDFQLDYKYKVNFDTINMEFYNLFVEYLENKNYKTNYIGKQIITLKTILNSATIDGVNTNLKYKSKEFQSLLEDTNKIYLTLNELKEIEDLDLSNNPRLDKARDLFLLLCYTGQRVQSLTDIVNPKKRDDNYIRLKQGKTSKLVSIPILPPVRKILNKYEKLSAITDQRLNNYIKEVCQMLPSLNETETTLTKKLGMTYYSKVPKYKLVSTHTGRRSFSTNFYLNGKFPISVIMKITGHSKETTFFKYIRMSPDDGASAFLNIYNKNLSKESLKVV